MKLQFLKITNLCSSNVNVVRCNNRVHLRTYMQLLWQAYTLMKITSHCWSSVMIYHGTSELYELRKSRQLAFQQGNSCLTNTHSDIYITFLSFAKYSQIYVYSGYNKNTIYERYTANPFPVMTTGISLCSNSHREFPVMNT